MKDLGFCKCLLQSFKQIWEVRSLKAMTWECLITELGWKCNLFMNYEDKNVIILPLSGRVCAKSTSE